MDELDEIRLKLVTTEQKLADLIEYLERKEILIYKPDLFEDWESQLHEMRNAEKKKREINKAKAFLEDEGLLVIRDESEIDALKLKKWVNTKTREE